MSKYLIKLHSKVITTKWWGQKWCNNISQYADFYNRLQRGRMYLRKGAVQDLVIEGGKVTASVVGSSATPYIVTIKIKPLVKEKAKKALENLHDITEFQRGFVSIDEKNLFSMDKNGLFPTIDEIDFSCTCPDWASLCKHCAAVLYAIGSILDQEPLVLFQLRGIDVDAYLETSLLEKTNTLLSNIYNVNNRTLDESKISDIFGIELEPIPDASTSIEGIDDTSKTVDIVRVIDIMPETKIKKTHSFESVIRQYNLDGVFIQQFKSYEDAENKTHVNKGQISEVCNGRKEIAGGYQWRIADSTDAANNISKYISPIDYSLLINSKIQQIDSNGNLIEEFSSALEASNKTNISINWIRDALSGRQKQAGGFFWKLLDIEKGCCFQKTVLKNQVQDIVRIKQTKVVHQNQKKLIQSNEQKKEQECLKLKKQQQEQLTKQKLLQKQEEDSKIHEKERIDKQRAFYRKKGLCQHCGGKFKKKFIFFNSDICSLCGKKKDY